jgi:hypothetical protein
MTALAHVNWRSISVEGGNPHFKVVDPVLLDGAGISLQRYCGDAMAVTIPDTVQELGYGCFSGCTTIATVDFAGLSRISCIPDSAFEGCSSLSSIYIPSSVKTLGVACFWKCTSLSLVTFGVDSKLSVIGVKAFSVCSSLSSICIPSSVEEISGESFSDCWSLSTVTFGPASILRSIGHQAFMQCPLLSLSLPSSVKPDAMGRKVTLTSGH